MAYNCWYSGNSLNSSDDYLAATASGFESCGWDLHDDFTATYKTKVYKSQGEENQYLPGFVEIWHQNGVQVFFRYYMYWDAGTHTGEVRGYWTASYCYLYFEPGYPITAYGDRDWMTLYTTHSSVTQYTRYKMFGFIKPYDDKTVTLTENATSGNNKVLTVSGSLGDLIYDRKYMIVGDQTEGRDDIYVNQIEGSTVTGTISITNLPRNYDAGAIIGHTPYTFAAWTYGSWRTLCDYSVAGVADTSNGPAMTYLLPAANVDPDVVTNRHILQPAFFREIAAAGYTPVGYMTSSGTGVAPVVGISAWDAQVLYTMGSYESGSSTNSSTSTMLNDTSKAWSTNEHIGKVFVYTNGAGEGQTRVIDSNDATNLYWNTPLHTYPVLSDEYRLYDGEVWRRVYAYACRELIY